MSDGEEPVAREADDEEPAGRFVKGLLERAVISDGVIVVHGFSQVEVAVCVEPVDEGLALVFEIGFDGEFRVEIVAVFVGGLELPAEFFSHSLLGEIGDVAYHSCDGQSAVGSVFVGVLSVGKIGVCQDRISTDGVECYRLGG